MNRETEIRKRRGTRVLLIVLAIWGLAVVVAAQTEIYKAIYPLVLASIIALGISHIMAFDLLRRHIGIEHKVEASPVDAEQRLGRPY
jgi:hypothetical protein